MLLGYKAARIGFAPESLKASLGFLIWISFSQKKPFFYLKLLSLVFQLQLMLLQVQITTPNNRRVIGSCQHYHYNYLMKCLIDLCTHDRSVCASYLHIMSYRYAQNSINICLLKLKLMILKFALTDFFLQTFVIFVLLLWYIFFLKH